LLQEITTLRKDQIYPRNRTDIEYICIASLE